MTADEAIEAIAEAIGDPALPHAGLTAATRLEADLCLDSLDLAALGAVLRERYGTSVDLPGYVAWLDIDEIIGLTVGEVAAYVNRQIHE
jgi:acyl carrier protein